MRHVFRRLVPCLLALFFAYAGSSRLEAAPEGELWAALNTPGHIALMRHALAPGGGDPDNFTLEDCKTQRNLSDAGRRQAQRTGEAFRANGIASALVLSSIWCRCFETGELLNVGEVSPLPHLNSLHRYPENRELQIAALRAKIAEMELTGPVVMTTHHSVILALMNTPLNSGEIAVVKRESGGTLTLVGQIAPRSTE